MCCTVPAPPTDVRLATTSSGSARAIWSASSDNGGAKSLSYSVSLTPNMATCETSGTECDFPDLKFGVAYTATVESRNSAGASLAVSSLPVALRPASLRAPRDVKAALSRNGASISWVPPIVQQGPEIRRYSVKATPSGKTCSTKRTTCSIRGLAAGRTYTFTVTAFDAMGRSMSSLESRPIRIPAPTRPAPMPFTPVPSAPVEEKPPAPVS